jgi:hypothetical protein
VSFGKASVYSQGAYRTPLGKVPVNVELANKLIDNNSCFTFNPEAHASEHSIEVQLPFIQYYFNYPPPIIPIVLGSQSKELCKDVADALKPYFTEDNLFIISADFSHYPAYETAVVTDKKTADAFCSGDPQTFLAAIKENAESRIPGLATSMCAWPAGLSLLYLAEDQDDISFNKILYQNSGDSKLKTGKSEVVGYHAISLNRVSKGIGFSLSDKDKRVLLQISRETLESYLPERKKKDLNTEDYGPDLQFKTGAFVSLKKNGKLRGCIGSFRPESSLFNMVQTLTIASATEDTRFLPVQRKELEEIDIEISVLTPMKKIEDPSQIVLGKHGIYITKDGRSGTFLPQVASETGWNLEEFLGHCARDKARIGWEGWKDADIFIYEAIVFGEKEKK